MGNATVRAFIDNQLSKCGLLCMHYSLSGNDTLIRFNYKPLYGIVNVNEYKLPNSKSIFLPAKEITWELLGEIKSVKVRVKEQIKYCESE